MIKALITQREELNRRGDLIESLEKDYIDYFSTLNILTIPISNFTNDADRIVDIVKPDIIILSGGGILPEDAYNFKKDGFQQVNRNRTEKKLINLALEKGISLLGICRGMQMLGYHFGAKIDDFSDLKIPRKVRERHKAIITETGEEIEVNNYHNDGIFTDKLPYGLKCAVEDENGTVEAFVSENNRILGIQWHPERPVDWKSEKIIHSFITNL